MADGFIWRIAVSTKRGMLWIESIVVEIYSCMCGPPLEDCALLRSFEFVDVVVLFGMVHLSVYSTSSFSLSPSVHPFLLGVILQDPFSGLHV